MVKNHMARNGDVTLSNLKQQLEDGLAKVDAETGVKVINNIKPTEAQFGNEDLKFDPSV
jgi:hypothetical protein